MALSTIGLVLLKTVQLQNHETALCQLYSFVNFIFKTQKPVNWQIVFRCFPFSGQLGLLGLDWVVGIKLQELGQLLSCGRGAQIDFAPLAGCLCLKQFLTNARVSLM